MPSEARANPWLRYGVALAAAAAALALRLGLDPWLGARWPLLPFGLGVVVAAWVGGLGPAWLATALGIVGAWALPGATPLLDLARFALIGLGAGALAEAIRRARSHRRGEAMFRALFERNPRPMWVFDRRSLRFLAVNNAAVEVYGYSRAEFLARTIEAIRPPEDLPALRDLLGRHGGDDLVDSGPWRHRTRDGTIIQVETTCSAVTFDGREARLVLAEDVTGRLADEAELRRAKHEAEASHEVMERFVAVVSHELSAPIGPVLPTVEHLLEVGTPSSAELRAALLMIRRNVELQARLIDDLRDAVRADRGRLRLEAEAVDLHELVARVVEICRPDLNAADVRLVLDLGARRPLVWGDAGRLQQVLWNLLKNAAKFTPARGVVRITSRDLPGAPGDLLPGRIAIEVADNGAGIAPAELEQIFAPFEQGGSASLARARDGGLGLGLSISRSIVEAHGGTLLAESDGPGLGSRFTLEMVREPLPLTDHVPPPPHHAAPRQKAAAPRPLKILLVDDNEDVLGHFALALGRRGHAVTVAESVANALDAVADDRFDLLISDLQLPDGSGLDLLRQIRAEMTPGPPLAAVVLSGYGSSDDIDESRAAGFAEHLAKPVPFAALEAAILRAMAEPVTAG